MNYQVQASGTGPVALNLAAMNAMRGLVMGDPASADAAKTEAAKILAKVRDIPIDQATQQVSEMGKQYDATVDAAKQQAANEANATASVLSTGAILTFIALVLGALAGWLGGRSGVIHPIYAEGVVPAGAPHQQVD